MKMRGIIRFAAVVALAVILLPFVFTAYLNISFEASPQDVGQALIDAVPLGGVIYNTAIAFLAGPEQGINSAVGWFENGQLSPHAYIPLELTQLFLIGVLLMALESLINLWVAKVDHGLFNQIANLLCKILFVFTASLLANAIYDFFLGQVSAWSGTSQEVMLFLVSVISLVGGAIALFFGGGFWKSMLACSLKIIEVILTYALCMILAFSLAPWYLVIGVWIFIIWLFYFLEKLLEDL